MYCNAVTGGLNHGHRQHTHKIWYSSIKARGQTHKQKDKQTLITTLRTLTKAK